jgi:hypothetical protein
MRKSSYLKAALVVTIALATLSSTTLPAPAATGSSKSLSSTQARKLYEQVANSTAKWVSTNPHVWTERWSTEDGRVDRTAVVVDRDGDVRFDDNSEITYLIGEMIYGSFEREDLADYEYEIAVDLGLAVDAKFAAISPAQLDPDFDLDGFRQDFTEQELPTWAELTGLDSKPTKISYRKSGKTETLAITSGKKTASGDSLFTTNVQIERGRVTSLKLDRTSVRDEYRSTITLKPFTGDVVQPAGPYLDWNKVYADPRYRASSEQAIAEATLYAIYREAKAMAAFAERTEPNLADWTEAASSRSDVVMFDRGFEFSIYPDGDRAVKVCAVYTDAGARAEMRPCSELEFTPLAP